MTVTLIKRNAFSEKKKSQITIGLCKYYRRPNRTVNIAVREMFYLEGFCFYYVYLRITIN